MQKERLYTNSGFWAIQRVSRNYGVGCPDGLDFIRYMDLDVVEELLT